MYQCSNCHHLSEQLTKFCAACGHQGLEQAASNGMETPEQVRGAANAENQQLEPQVTGYAATTEAGQPVEPPTVAVDPSEAPQQLAATGKTADAEPPRPDTSAHKRRLIGLLSIGIAVIVLIAGGWFTAKALFHKSPKQMYLLAEQQWLQSKGHITEGQRQDDELREALAKRAHDFAVELTASLQSDIRDEYDRREIEEVASVLENGKLRLFGKRDMVNGWGDITAQLNYDNAKIFDLNVLYDEEKLAVSSEQWLDSSYVMNKDELKDIFSGLTSNEPFEEEDAEQEADLTESTESYDGVAAILERYGQHVQDLLHDEYFTLEEGVTITSANGEIKGQKVTLTIGEEELKELAIGLIDQLRADPEAQQLLADYLVTWMSYPFGEMYGMEHLDRKYIAEQLGDALYELRRAVQESRSIGKLTIEAYMTKSGEMIARKAVYRVNASGVVIEVSLDSNKSRGEGDAMKTEHTLEIEVRPGGGERATIVLDMTMEETPTKEYIQSDAQYRFMLRDDSGTILDAELHVLAERARTHHGDDTYEFKLRLLGDELDDDFDGIDGELVVERDQDLKKNYAYRGFKGQLTARGYNRDRVLESVTFGLNAEFDVKFDEQLSKPEVSGEINLSQKSEEEWERLLDDTILPRLFSPFAITQYRPLNDSIDRAW